MIIEPLSGSAWTSQKPEWLRKGFLLKRVETVCRVYGSRVNYDPIGFNI